MLLTETCPKNFINHTWAFSINRKNHPTQGLAEQQELLSIFPLQIDGPTRGAYMVGLTGGSTWVHPFPPGLLIMVWRWWLPTQKLSSAWFSIRANCHFSCRPLEKAHNVSEIKNLFKIKVRYVSIYDFIEGMLQYLKDTIRFQSMTK